MIEYPVLVLTIPTAACDTLAEILLTFNLHKSHHIKIFTIRWESQPRGKTWGAEVYTCLVIVCIFCIEPFFQAPGSLCKKIYHFNSNSHHIPAKCRQ